MFASGNDQSLLNCCGVDHKAFQELLDIFEPFYNLYTYDTTTGAVVLKNKIKGRKRELDSTGCLGLLLFWFRTQGSVSRSVSLAFGLTSTPMYKWITFARRVMLVALQKNSSAVVRLPNREETERYIQAMAEKYPLLGQHRVWAACDGLKLNLQRSTNWRLQNRFYNGWTSRTHVNSVLLFAPDGKICACILNCPGSWHDSTQAEYGLYRKMEQIYDQFNAKVVVDLAFNVKSNKSLIKSSQSDPDTPEAILLNQAATSCRQMSEWGMRQLQGGFPRINDNLKLGDVGERKVILYLMVHLYNYQTSQIKINTITNTFASDTPGFFSYGLVPTETANDCFATL